MNCFRGDQVLSLYYAITGTTWRYATIHFTCIWNLYVLPCWWHQVAISSDGLHSSCHGDRFVYKDSKEKDIEKLMGIRLERILGLIIWSAYCPGPIQFSFGDQWLIHILFLRIIWWASYPINFTIDTQYFVYSVWFLTSKASKHPTSYNHQHKPIFMNSDHSVMLVRLSRKMLLIPIGYASDSFYASRNHSWYGLLACWSWFVWYGVIGYWTNNTCCSLGMPENGALLLYGCRAATVRWNKFSKIAFEARSSI